MINVDTVVKIGKLVVSGLGLALPIAQKAISDREMKKHVSDQFTEVINELVDKKLAEAIANMKAE